MKNTTDVWKLNSIIAGRKLRPDFEAGGNFHIIHVYSQLAHRAQAGKGDQSDQQRF